jgi:hypothetical protein
MVIKLTRLIKVFMWVLHLVLKDYDDDDETARLRQINSLLERGIPKDTKTLNAKKVNRGRLGTNPESCKLSGH